jgi:phenylacetate-CoA ligase
MKAFPLEPIEKASIDELRTLQLKRLKATLAHAYANSPVYKAKFDAAGVHPSDLKTLSDLAKFPFTYQDRTCATAIPSACSPCRGRSCARIHASSGTTGKPTVVGYTLRDIDTWANLIARSIRAAGGGRATWCTCELWLRPVHRRPWRALRGRDGSACTVVPISAAGRPSGRCTLIQDFKARHHHGHAQLHAVDLPTNSERQGFNPRGLLAAASASSGPSPGPTTCAWKSNSAFGHARRRHLWPVRGHGPWRGQRMRGNQGRPAPSGKTISTRKSSTPRPARSVPDGEMGELVFTTPDQGRRCRSSATAPAT